MKLVRLCLYFDPPAMTISSLYLRMWLNWSITADVKLKILT